MSFSDSAAPVPEGVSGHPQTDLSDASTRKNGGGGGGHGSQTGQGQTQGLGSWDRAASDPAHKGHQESQCSSPPLTFHTSKGKKTEHLGMWSRCGHGGSWQAKAAGRTLIAG